MQNSKQRDDQALQLKLSLGKEIVNFLKQTLKEQRRIYHEIVRTLKG